MSGENKKYAKFVLWEIVFVDCHCEGITGFSFAVFCKITEL